VFGLYRHWSRVSSYDAIEDGFLILLIMIMIMITIAITIMIMIMITTMEKIMITTRFQSKD
jgi:hypothetical protein